MTQTQRDNLNSYLTWGNVWKAITVLCACTWFVFNVLRDNTVRDMRIDQSQKDMTEIKDILKNIQIDIKNNSASTERRLNSIEQRVLILETKKH